MKEPGSFHEGVKSRVEIETPVESAERTLAILAGLGFQPVRRYQKRRETWSLDRIVVALDETPAGNFVEVEGPSDRLAAAAGDLGLDPRICRAGHLSRRLDLLPRSPPRRPGSTWCSPSSPAPAPVSLVSVKGMLLTAGLGRRMEPLSSVVPKPALEVLGRPLLSSALANLRRAGCAGIVANLHRHPELVAAAARSAGGGTVAFSREPELLGGAGGVAAARPLLGEDDVLVGNGDTWGDLDLAPLLAAQAPGTVALALIPHPDPRRWSSVILGEDGLVTAVRPARVGRSGRALPLHRFPDPGRETSWRRSLRGRARWPLSGTPCAASAACAARS